MIRLVHQFDTPRTRVSAAAPKSGDASCCCCCCCVATLVTSGIVTTRSLGRDPNQVTNADQIAPPLVGPGTKVLAVLLLPLALGCGAILAAINPAIGGLAGIGGYVGGALVISRQAKRPGLLALFLLVGVPAMVAGEAALWMAMIFK